MAISRQVDLLEPVNLADHLDKVELYLGQVCQIAGISKMQLDYWTNKAQIPTKGKKQRIYDIDALETVMLIKQAKDKGLNLGAAIEAARRFREARGVAMAGAAGWRPPRGPRSRARADSPREPPAGVRSTHARRARARRPSVPQPSVRGVACARQLPAARTRDRDSARRGRSS